MKRVLVVTRNLPPYRGGMERLNLGVTAALALKAEVVVVGPAGCRAHLSHCADVREISAASLHGFLWKACEAVWELRKSHFDVVIAGSGLTAPMALLAARFSGAKALAYVHGLDIVATHPVYRLFWLAALRRLDGAIANSANTASLARKAGVAAGNLTVVHPGSHMPSFDGLSSGRFRDRFKLGEGPLLLSVGRLTERKGLAEFVDLTMPLIVARHRSIRLIVIGDDAPDALRRNSSSPADRLNEAIRRHQLQKHVIRLGPCDDDTLSQAYGAADVHVFPVKHVAGDIEGFGMVAIEAAAHGLPTVAFAVGGVSDAILEGESGSLCHPGDHESFAEKVVELIESQDRKGQRDSARRFAERFSWSRFNDKLWRAVQITTESSISAPKNEASV